MAAGMMIIKNNRNVSGWSLQNGYADPYDMKNYPFQGISLNLETLFSIGLHVLTNDFEYKCRGIDQGYKLVLSMPGEVPRMSYNYFRISLMHMNEIAITPEITITTEGLRHYEPNQRRCFFNDERRLRFFKIYTETNCEVECLANFTKKMCACVKFSMPSMYLNFSKKKPN